MGDGAFGERLTFLRAQVRRFVHRVPEHGQGAASADEGAEELIARLIEDGSRVDLNRVRNLPSDEDDNPQQHPADAKGGDARGEQPSRAPRVQHNGIVTLRRANLKTRSPQQQRPRVSHARAF